MGRYKTHAKDGSPRYSDPQQDSAGNWCCPKCGKAVGFKSKHSVLGHLRFCRDSVAGWTATDGEAKPTPKWQSSYAALTAGPFRLEAKAEPDGGGFEWKILCVGVVVCRSTTATMDEAMRAAESKVREWINEAGKVLS